MDFYSTDIMLRVVSLMHPAPQFLLDKYFVEVQTENADEIHFDVWEELRRVSPFVLPLVEGQIVEMPGYATTTFKPPYIKDKRVFDTQRPYRRMAGEGIGGTLSPQDRMRAYLAASFQDQLNMLARRQEIMAAEALQTGGMIIEGDKYPRVQLNFGRSASLTITASVAWDQPTATPLSDLERLNDAMLAVAGQVGFDVIMGAKAWKAFRKNTEVQNWLSMYRGVGGRSPMEIGGLQVEGAQSMGQVDNFNIYVYGGQYIDPMTGTSKSIWDESKVVLTSTAIDGVRCYGAIKDHDALIAVPYYPKSWEEEDPSVRFLMLQSAPLPVPTRINASGVINNGIAP